MGSKMNNVMAFLAGVVVGTLITRHYAKKIYGRIAQEEIDSVKQAFNSRKQAEVPKSGLAEYEDIMQQQGYTAAPDETENDAEEEKIVMTEMPYVISPDEFGERDEYERISLTYYADHILADDNDEPLEDVDNVIGFESLNHFGEFEDDSVFVRNDRLKCDYEILLDHRRYTDIPRPKSN